MSWKSCLVNAAARKPGYGLIFIAASIVVICLSLLSPGMTATAETISLTLDEAIALGLEKSTSLKARQSAVLASRADFRAAKSAYYPIFSANANWTHLFDQTTTPAISLEVDAETINIPGSYVTASDPVTLSFDAQQSIYAFGRIKHAKALAEHGLYLAEQDLTEGQRSLIVAIKRVFYGYILAREVVAVQEETLSQQEETLRIAQERFDAGLVPDFEVLSTESDVENFKPTLISARNEVELALLAVKDLLNIVESEDFDIELLGDLSPEQYDFEKEDIISRALQSNYDLKQFRTGIALAEYNQLLAGDEKKPIIGCFANYSVNSSFDSSTGKNKYWGDGAWRDLLSVGVNVSIPLSAFLPYSGESAAEKKAEFELNELQMELSTVENSMKLGVETILLKIEEEEAKIRSSNKAVELAARLYESASERFASGFVTRIELKDAQVRLNTARLGYLSSVYQHKLAVFDLMDAIGIYEF